jgi:hypothetical protein
MTAQVRQGGGGRVLRLGYQPDDNIAARDHATDLIMLNHKHVANIGDHMARAASCTEAVPGSATGLGA